MILPARFANLLDLVEEVSETERHIRIANTGPVDEAPFSEEQLPLLVDKDRDFLLALLSAPPKSGSALKEAAAEHRRLQW